GLRRLEGGWAGGGGGARGGVGEGRGCSGGRVGAVLAAASRDEFLGAAAGRAERQRSRLGRPPVWLVSQDSADWGEECPCGLLVADDIGGGEWEMLGWLRGAYRSLGDGAEALGGSLPEVMGG